MKRLPHAALGGAGRLRKAEKIFRLLGLVGPSPSALKVLEVGTGSGVIAQYFAHQLGDGCEVIAVDVIDQRIVHDGYRFLQVKDTTLPFADETFDIVISNHVVEHVGMRDDQIAHVRELGRVLKGDGKGYLAVPSRWQVVEPHYRLAFLSWLPRSLRDGYLRIRGRGSCYDCEPLQRNEIEDCFRAAGLGFRNQVVSALRALVNIEGRASLVVRLVAAMPEKVLYGLRSLCPTHIYLFDKRMEMPRHG